MKKTIARCLFRAPADRRPGSATPAAGLHIVVPRWDAKLGDSIVSSFFFREARKLNARVTVLTVPELAPLHAQDFGVDRVIVTQANPGLLELCKIAGQLGQVDAVVHLVGRIQPAEIVFLRLLRPSRVYSFDDELRCVNRKFGAATQGLSYAQCLERVLLDLGASAVECQYMVPLPEHFQPSAAPQILINPYGSRPDKSLSPAQSLALLRAIADACPDKAMGILCSPATHADAAQLAAAVARDNVQALEDLATPRDAAGYLQRAQVVISVDTAIVHMAVGLGTRLIAIYPAMGAEHNPWLPPPAPSTLVVYSQQDVAQYRRTGRKDMNRFAVQEVVDGLHRLLADAPDPGGPQLVLQARIVSGLGVATGTLARQLPLLSRDFPEVGNCHPATINLELQRPLVISAPDHRSAPLAWTPSGRTTEVFDLLRIELQLDQRPLRIPAWLYIAHGSPHRQTPTIHEVIAPRLDLSGVSSCRVHLRASAVAALES